MLSGRKPYAEDSRDPLRALRAVLEQEPPAPSVAAGAAGRPLRGELDAVVLHALNKNPDERYPSVRAFAEDIRAWLDGRPVDAHPDAPWRRAVKFIRPNRTPSLAAALVLLAVLGGAAVSLWQAQVARRERARAEGSFRELRQFSRSVLFELNDAIRNLPGSTPARELLIRRSTELLDNLRRNARTDTALKLELVEGYRRLGQIQGSAFSDSLGREADAIMSFRKAVELAEEACVVSRIKWDVATALLGAYTDLSAALLWNGDRNQADAVDTKLRQTVARLEGSPGIEDGVRLSIATSYSSLGFNRVQREDLAAVKADFRRAADHFESLAGRGVRLPELNDQYVIALKRLGAVLIKEGSLEEAERRYRRALEIEEADLARRPADRRLSLDRASTLSDLALILKRKKDLSSTAKIDEEAVSVRRAALRSDPENQRFLDLTVS